MRTAAILSTLATLGCGTPEPPPNIDPHRGPPLGPGQINQHDASREDVRTREDCSRYSERPDFFGFCLHQVAQRGEGQLGAGQLCEGAGIWDSDCHNAWAIARARPNSDWSKDVLLDACRASDCRFEILDFRPHPDVTEQIRLCSEHAGHFGGDCAAHAMDRWLRANPSESEFTSLKELELFPDRIGHYMGLAVGCFSIGVCGEETDADERCQTTIREISDNPNMCVAMRDRTP